jgi:hypothetical protein
LQSLTGVYAVRDKVNISAGRSRALLRKADRALVSAAEVVLRAISLA